MVSLFFASDEMENLFHESHAVAFEMLLKLNILRLSSKTANLKLVFLIVKFVTAGGVSVPYSVVDTI